MRTCPPQTPPVTQAPFHSRHAPQPFASARIFCAPNFVLRPSFVAISILRCRKVAMSCSHRGFYDAVVVVFGGLKSPHF